MFAKKTAPEGVFTLGDARSFFGLTSKFYYWVVLCVKF